MWWIAVLVIFRWNSCDSAGFIPCHSNWTRVLQTDETGMVESGSKKALIEAVLDGAQLQVFVPDWNYASSVQMITIGKNYTKLCAQALFHISKDSWNSFRSDAYWYFLYLCTNGNIDKARWFVGKHEQPSTVDSSAQTSIRLRILWFVRFSHGYGNKEADPIFCNSDQGNKTCGSLDNLLSAVKMGAEIRANAFGQGPESNHAVIPFNSIISLKNESTDYIVGQCIWNADLEENKFGTLTLKKNGTWLYFDLSTTGLSEVGRWNLGANDTSGPREVRLSVNWFADTCWMLAYKHDIAGTSVDGSVNFLREAILNGHRVKITFELLGATRVGVSLEIDNLILTHGVSAQILNFIDLFKRWQMIHFSSSGEGESITYNTESIIKTGNFNYTTSASWFIDTQAWIHVLSTSTLGIVTFGSKTDLMTYIRKGSMLRCVIKFNQTHILAAQADNVEFSPDGTNIGAQILRIVSYTTAGNSGRQFENVPHWRFTIVTTTGLIRQSEWVVGEHTTRKTDPLTADIDWFVN